MDRSQQAPCGPHAVIYRRKWEVLQLEETARSALGTALLLLDMGRSRFARHEYQVLARHRGDCHRLCDPGHHLRVGHAFPEEKEIVPCRPRPSGRGLIYAISHCLADSLAKKIEMSEPTSTCNVLANSTVSLMFGIRFPLVM
jgi:hypothetical protein